MDNEITVLRITEFFKQTASISKTNVDQRKKIILTVMLGIR